MVERVSAADGPLLVGGLGWPHDELVVATLDALGQPSETLGALDVDALERGRAALPRGQCAPMLYTTGALLRRASQRGRPLTMLDIQSCGPCRYALFGRGYRHALERLGLPPLELIELGQRVETLVEAFGHSGAHKAIDALVAADALREAAHRLRPYERTPGAIDAAARTASASVARRIEAHEDPIEALEAVAGWHEGRWSVGQRALARAALVGEPWSLHVEGDGQLNLPRLLARAGVEVEIAPFATWLAYLAWQTRQPRFGGDDSPRFASIDGGLVNAFEAHLEQSYRRAGAALGLEGFEVPDIDELTELASPHLTPSIRGGYGHLEIGLALKAKCDRRAHFTISVKSFGCIPSAGISDAILPSALGELPFLSLEVCADGEAARESRLAMRVAAALDEAERELGEARSTGRQASAHHPLRIAAGERRYACTLADELARTTLAVKTHPGHPGRR